MTVLARGREADVHAAGQGRVRRRYRDGSSPQPEVALMRHVAAHGYPVPVVHEVDGADMVMDRVEGPTMLEAMLCGVVDVPAAAGVLARLHDLLHSVPARQGAAPGDVVVHGDLHPENVLLAASGPVVIDWRNGRDGPADLDVAVTALVLAQVAVDDADERAPLARIVLPEFLDRVHGSAIPHLAWVVERRSVEFPGAAARALIERAAALVRAVDREPI